MGTEDKAIIWSNQIQGRASASAKSILDTLVAIDRAGFKNMTLSQRQDVHSRIADEIVKTMMQLGTFVTAGGGDFREATLKMVKLDDKVTTTVIPADVSTDALRPWQENRGKSVVIVFTNKLSFEQAREALSKAIHREQTDWVAQAVEEEAQRPADPPDETMPATNGEPNEEQEAEQEEIVDAFEPSDETKL